MALAFVEGQVKNATATPGATPAFTNALAVGQIVVVYIGYDGGVTGLTTGVTDSKGNTYSKVTGMDIANAGGTLALDCWWATVTTGHTGASPTVSVAFNDTSTNANIAVQIFNGFTGTPTLDQVQHSSNASSTTCTSGTTGLIINTNELIVGGGVHASTASAWTLGTTYTNLTSSDVASRSVAMESKVVALATTEVATFTIAAARVNIGGVVTFYDAVSAPSVAITQVAATVTATGRTQTVVSVSSASISQVAATPTATGGTQVVAAVQKTAISQIAANITATGGTQVVVTFQQASISQVTATVTATGGTQTAAVRASVAQVAATLTITGGTQAIGAVQDVSISQSHATLTATGGTQTVATVRIVSISQVGGTVTATGGTQTIVAKQLVTISQLAASLLVSTGTQTVSAITPPAFVFLTTIVSGGQNVGTETSSATATTDSSGSNLVTAGGGDIIQEIAGQNQTDTVQGSTNQTEI